MKNKDVKLSLWSMEACYRKYLLTSNTRLDLGIFTLLSWDLVCVCVHVCVWVFMSIPIELLYYLLWTPLYVWESTSFAVFIVPFMFSVSFRFHSLFTNHRPCHHWNKNILKKKKNKRRFWRSSSHLILTWIEHKKEANLV